MPVNSNGTMKTRMINCVVLFITCITSRLVFGQEFEDAENGDGNGISSFAGIAASSSKEISKSNSRLLGLKDDQVCFRDCSWWGCTTYYCKDGVCCTPGSPTSICCPEDTPICAGKDRDILCCPTASPKRCGENCCKTDSYCCEEEVCCKDENSCCNQQCCIDQAPCCKYGDEKKCCSEITMACCDGYGCVEPCESQFDAIECQLNGLGDEELERKEEIGREGKAERENFKEAPERENLQETSETERGKETSEKSREAREIPDILYRVLRSDENPAAIVPKDITEDRTILSHVNCGSRKNYRSQFISTTTSLDVAREYQSRKRGLRICQFDVNVLRQHQCDFFDLTTEEGRNLYLGDAVMAKNFAGKSEEVVLFCHVPVPCNVIG